MAHPHRPLPIPALAWPLATLCRQSPRSLPWQRVPGFRLGQAGSLTAAVRIGEEARVLTLRALPGRIEGRGESIHYALGQDHIRLRRGDGWLRCPVTELADGAFVLQLDGGACALTKTISSTGRTMITTTPGAPLPHARHHSGDPGRGRAGRHLGQPAGAGSHEDGARPESGQGQGGRRPALPPGGSGEPGHTLLVHFATDHDETDEQGGAMNKEIRSPVDRVSLVEMGPRDGLQTRLACCRWPSGRPSSERLVACGLQHIEVGAFVSRNRCPRWQTPPPCSRRYPRKGCHRYGALVPNLQGLQGGHPGQGRRIGLFTRLLRTASPGPTSASAWRSPRGAFAPLVAEARSLGIR